MPRATSLVCSKMKEILLSRSPEETEQAGAHLAALLAAHRVGEKWFVCLYGDLGAGKTAFTRGFAAALSPGSRVKSPTYNIVHEYRGGEVPVYHFDLYRLEGSEEALDEIGFDDYVSGGHCIVEWSEFLPRVPEGAVRVTIRKTGDDAREISMEF